jgi:hypothetical protein
MKWPALVLLILVQLWCAHAIVFFAHEYSHAFVAWTLGWKHNPLDLDYSHPSLKTFLIQLGINQKVDEGPIYAAGRPMDAGLIALAGMVLGNGIITYPLSRLGYRQAITKGHPGWALFAFWTTVASVGNFIDYVPIRTFSGAQGSDMGSIERAFGWSPWLVVLLLGAPTLIATVHLLWRIIPTTVEQLFASPAARYAIAILSAFIVFGFYGCVGLLEGGPIARWMSLVSIFALMPAAAALEIFLLRKRRAPLGFVRGQPKLGEKLLTVVRQGQERQGSFRSTWWETEGC